MRRALQLLDGLELDLARALPRDAQELAAFLERGFVVLRVHAEAQPQELRLALVEALESALQRVALQQLAQGVRGSGLLGVHDRVADHALLLAHLERGGQGDGVLHGLERGADLLLRQAQQLGELRDAGVAPQ